MKSEVGKEGKERRGEERKTIRGEMQVEVLPQESKEWIGRGERRKIDRGIEIESALQNEFWSRRMSNEARRLNFVRVPKIPMRRIH